MEKLKLRLEALKAEKHDLETALKATISKAIENLVIRRADAERDVGRRQAKVQSLQSDYNKQKSAADKKVGSAERKVEVAKKGKDAARQNASKIMAKEPVGIEFRPESTTKETIDEAVKRPRDRAARDLGLPFGLGTKAGWLDILSYISAFFGWIFLTLQFGLLFRGISFMGSGVKVERLPLIGATALAAMVVLVAQVAIRKIFAEVGVRVAQQKHSLFLFILAGVVLVGAAIAWSCMDATVVKDLASARARLNPSMALSWGHALLIGSLIGGLSTISIAAAGFTTGYRREALALVEAARADDLALAQVHINYIASVESLAAWHDSIEGLRDVELELQRLQRQLKTELDQKAAEIAKAEMERNSAERNVPKRIEQDFTPEERTRLAELRAEIANTQDKIDGLQEQLEGEGMTAPADPPKPPKTPPMAAAVENDDDDDNPKQGLRMVI